MERSWKTGDMAKLAGLTIRTLRYYDQIGLFSPSAQTASGHRLYNEADLIRLQQIMSLKELGLSLEEIKTIIDGQEYSLYEIVNLQKERVKEQLNIQQELLEQLTNLSKALQMKAPLTVEDFMVLLQTMKKNHEKRILERNKDWELRFQWLEEMLEQKKQSKGELRDE